MATFQSLIVRSRVCVSSDTNVPPAGSSRRLVTGATWPLSVHRQFPVVRSQIQMCPFSWPLSTQPSLDEISSATQFTPGFHFLNSVPDCRSYTTMKLGPGSSTSCACGQRQNLYYSKFTVSAWSSKGKLVLKYSIFFLYYFILLSYEKNDFSAWIA